MGLIRISDGLEVAELMWPEFIQERGAIFLKSERKKSTFSWKKVETLLDLESLVNHVHILDNFKHTAKLNRAPWWNSKSRDFALAMDLANRMTTSWAAKLAGEFPVLDFAIFATRDENPIVRFHCIRKDGKLWLDPIKRAAWFSSGGARLIRVTQGKVGLPIGRLVGTKNKTSKQKLRTK